MKYLAIVDDEFLKDFRLDDGGLTLVVHDETTGTRAMPLKPLHRSVLILQTGDSLYLTQGHIDALIAYEDKKAVTEAVRQINEGIQGVTNEYNKKPNVDIITVGKGCFKCPSHARCQDAFQTHSHLCNHYDKTEKEFEDWLKGKHR
jgi:hypothetical protein